MSQCSWSEIKGAEVSLPCKDTYSSGQTFDNILIHDEKLMLGLSVLWCSRETCSKHSVVLYCF